jgi:hypothetical protein
MPARCTSFWSVDNAVEQLKHIKMRLLAGLGLWRLQLPALRLQELGFPVRPPGACPRTAGTGRLQMRPLRPPQRSRRGCHPSTVPQSPLRVCAPGARRLQPRPLCPLPRRHGSTLQHAVCKRGSRPPRRHRGFRYHRSIEADAGGLQAWPAVSAPRGGHRGFRCHRSTLQHRRLRVHAQLPPRRHGRLRFYRATLPQRSFSVMTVATRRLQMQHPSPLEEAPCSPTSPALTADSAAGALAGSTADKTGVALSTSKVVPANARVSAATTAAAATAGPTAPLRTLPLSRSPFSPNFVHEETGVQDFGCADSWRRGRRRGRDRSRDDRHRRSESRSRYESPEAFPSWYGHQAGATGGAWSNQWQGWWQHNWGQQWYQAWTGSWQAPNDVAWTPTALALPQSQPANAYGNQELVSCLRPEAKATMQEAVFMMHKRGSPRIPSSGQPRSEDGKSPTATRSRTRREEDPSGDGYGVSASARQRVLTLVAT